MYLKRLELKPLNCLLFCPYGIVYVLSHVTYHTDLYYSLYGQHGTVLCDRSFHTKDLQCRISLRRLLLTKSYF
jgi:hypothetical protein